VCLYVLTAGWLHSSVRILLEKIHSDLTHITKRHKFAFFAIDSGDRLIEHSGPASGSHLDIPFPALHLSPRKKEYSTVHQLDNYRCLLYSICLLPSSKSERRQWEYLSGRCVRYASGDSRNSAVLQPVREGSEPKVHDNCSKVSRCHTLHPTWKILRCGNRV